VKTSRILALASIAICAALIAGCSTPDTRIKSSPDVFARLNPDQQALVKSGHIAVGFEMDAVRLALGDPDRVLLITNAAGQHEVWNYVTYEDYQGGIIFEGYYHRYRGWGGPYFYGGVPFYDGYPARIHSRIHIVFDASGRVESIQQEKP
jgi:outer membrane protein assembly factor BamE (lipoprotein component of BamABCDE complex)